MILLQIIAAVSLHSNLICESVVFIQLLLSICTNISLPRVKVKSSLQFYFFCSNYLQIYIQTFTNYTKILNWKLINNFVGRYIQRGQSILIVILLNEDLWEWVGRTSRRLKILQVKKATQNRTTTEVLKCLSYL